MLGLGTLAKKIFGTANDRIVKQYLKRVEGINALEAEFEALNDDQLRAKTQEFRDRLEAGATLDLLLEEAFATVREAAKRTLGQRHFDVQLVGGMVLHDSSIAEMKTGEGKTLVATLACYLNALPGKGVHVVTVNDYLASRDSAWMGEIYNFLGMTVGVIIHGLSDAERREAYASDITYGTNNEYGFDYLRDNMKFSLDQMVQRPFEFAVVDEVDSILVDEARTPLIISGPTEDKSDLYVEVDEIIQQLEEGDFEKDEKSQNITLTEQGVERIEDILRTADNLKGDNLYDYDNTALVHHVNQALRARNMFEAEKDYIVKDGQVVIIDEFTGRMMEGRRYSDGLHQALEAKEGVEIQPENQTLASVTYQNYFRMYPRLSGMTGTAATEAQEFGDIYGLGVVEIPTNLPVARIDEEDEFYRTAAEKYDALIIEIRDAQANGQPILVGTVSIEKSEILAGLLTKANIKHSVLNARFHEQEAFIIAQAGHSGTVTIATNMAGRGTDIQLGGHLEMRIQRECGDLEEGAERDAAIARIKEEIAADRARVIEAGGLYVICTERHESRRIDNQLRGRTGRQGDPGRSKFFLSLQDDLMRIFGPERMDGMLLKLGIEEGEAIVHPWITKAIEKAQQKVEARNYDTRKNLLKFDNVMNDQRHVIYDQRRDVMQSEDVADVISDMRIETANSIVETHVPPKSYPEQWDTDGLHTEILRVFGMDVPISDWAKEEGIDARIVVERIEDLANRRMAEKAANYGPDVWRQVEKSLLLQIIDQDWKEHLSTLEYLRQVVGLRAYGQRDPLNEYKTEAFGQFESLLVKVREGITQLLAQVEISVAEPAQAVAPREPEMIEKHINPMTGENDMARDALEAEAYGRVPRNSPCPCGSGRKYKHCHGAIAGAAGPVASTLPALPRGFDPDNPDTWSGYQRNAPCPCGSGRKFKQCHGRL